MLAVVLMAVIVAALTWYGAHDRATSGQRDDQQVREPVARTDGSRPVPATRSTKDVNPPDAPPAQPGLAAGPRAADLPAGERQVNGLPVGFPATAAGAVAAQMAFTSAQIGFDADQAADVARLYAAPADRSALVRRALASVAQRRSEAGIPATISESPASPADAASDGDVPAPASYAVTPIAYDLAPLEVHSPVGSWPDESAADASVSGAGHSGVDRVGAGPVLVHLLNYVTLTRLDASSGDHLYVGTQLLDWVDGDWKILDPSPAERTLIAAQPQPAAAAPGTPEFARAGWTVLDLEAS